ncbi:MAG: hypothetical protein GX024_00135 [Clostridiales bacterium]|nr:hypothetical protein [Clostridiales bacterium]
MDWMKIFAETLETSWNTIFKMIYIVIPLFILIECLKDSGWFEKISSKTKKITKLFGLPGESALGITIGLLVGLTFGSGVVMQIKEDVNINRVQLNILFTFIGICHAIIEETILFTTVGANGAILLLNRIIMALAFTVIYMVIHTYFRQKAVKKTNAAM